MKNIRIDLEIRAVRTAENPCADWSGGKTSLARLTFDSKVTFTVKSLKKIAMADCCAADKKGRPNVQTCCDEKGQGGEGRDAPTIAEDIVVTKYKMAAEIVNRKPPVLLKS